MVTSDEPVQGAVGRISSMPAVTSEEGNVQHIQDGILFHFYSTVECHLAFHDTAVKSTMWPQHCCVKGQLLAPGRAHWLQLCSTQPLVHLDWPAHWRGFKVHVSHLYVFWEPIKRKRYSEALKYWQIHDNFLFYCVLQFPANINDGHKNQHKGSAGCQQMGFGTCLKWCWSQYIKKEINPAASLQ